MHQDGGLLPHVQDPLSSRFCRLYGGELGGSQDCARTSAVSSVVRFMGPEAAGEGVVSGGWSHGRLRGWGYGVPSSTATAAQLSVTVGATVAGRLWSCVLPPLLLPGSLVLEG